MTEVIEEWRQAGRNEGQGRDRTEEGEGIDGKKEREEIVGAEGGREEQMTGKGKRLRVIRGDYGGRKDEEQCSEKGLKERKER